MACPDGYGTCGGGSNGGSSHLCASVDCPDRKDPCLHRCERKKCRGSGGGNVGDGGGGGKDCQDDDELVCHSTCEDDVEVGMSEVENDVDVETGRVKRQVRRPLLLLTKSCCCF